MKINGENGIISVYGVGQISVLPNIIKINIKINHIGKTVNEAQSKVNDDIKTLLNIFKDNNIENVQTNIINFQPEYEWTNKKNVLKGQKVEQGLIVTINNLEKNIQKAKDLIDKITIDIDAMHCRVSFGIDNYEETLTEARNLAYSNALEKAKQYSSLANLEIMKVIKISEFEPRDMDLEYYSVNERASAIQIGSSTELPISSIDIEAKLFCDFLVK